MDQDKLLKSQLKFMTDRLPKNDNAGFEIREMKPIGVRNGHYNLKDRPFNEDAVDILFGEDVGK